MLRYDIEKLTLSDENSELLSVNVELIDRVRIAIAKHLEGAAQSIGRDEEDAKTSFVILLEMSLRCALEAGPVASRLGVTQSTVHRWSKGTFVPPQKFVRDAVLERVMDMLDEQKANLTHAGRRATAGDAASDDLAPKLIATFKDATSGVGRGRAGAKVIDLCSGSSALRKARGEAGDVDGTSGRTAGDVLKEA